MGVTCRTIWCATCATKLGLPFTSLKTDSGALRWGYVLLPFATCDCCRGRLRRHDIAAAVSTFAKPEDYWGWEEAYLYDMDTDEAFQGGK
jgi:hypothetical protein